MPFFFVLFLFFPYFSAFSGFLSEFIYWFLERGEGRKEERERHIYVWLPLACLLPRNPTCNPGMCPDWESNWRPFVLQAGTQSTELHQPGLHSVVLIQHFIWFYFLSFLEYQFYFLFWFPSDFPRVWNIYLQLIIA